MGREFVGYDVSGKYVTDAQVRCEEAMQSFVAAQRATA
jgi:hypothetical protein